MDQQHAQRHNAFKPVEQSKKRNNFFYSNPNAAARAAI